MLVLKRKEGEWVEITHRSGDLLRLRVYGIKGRQPGRANLAFDDPERNFDIQRIERLTGREPAAESVGPIAEDATRDA